MWNTSRNIYRKQTISRGNNNNNNEKRRNKRKKPKKNSRSLKEKSKFFEASRVGRRSNDPTRFKVCISIPEESLEPLGEPKRPREFRRSSKARNPERDTYAARRNMYRRAVEGGGEEEGCGTRSKHATPGLRVKGKWPEGNAAERIRGEKGGRVTREALNARP